VITLVDLRERKRAESQQQHEAFLAGVSEMSATILHNIGNAIQGITSGANQLEGKMQGYQKLIEAVEQFNQQALEPQQRHERDRALLQELPQLLRELVESDNQYSNLNPIEMIQYSAQHVTEIIQMHRRGFRMDLNQVRTALSQLLDDALLLVGNKISCRGIALHKMLQLNGFRDCFLLPKNQLLQALINMLNNAVEAVEEQHPGGGGEIGLQIAAQQPVAEAPIELIVEVSDNGVGIDEKARRKVLQFGYSTKNRGSGFGLHATANFVRNLDGSIEVSSDGVGCGTRVRLRIPVQPG
jgi:signal transduction histidine kinase